MRAIRLPPWLRLAGLLILWGAAGFLFGAMERDKPMLPHTSAEALDAASIKDRRKIVIIGGSNALTSLSDTYLRQDLGVPVFNLSVKQDAGDDRILFAIAAGTVRPGDMLVLSFLDFVVPDYLRDGHSASSIDMYLAARLGSLYRPIETHPLPWRPLPWTPLLNFIGKEVGPEAAFSSFDDPSPQCGAENSEASFPLGAPPAAYWQELARRTEPLRQKGISIYAALPWVAAKSAGGDQLLGLLQNAQEQLAQIGIPVLAQAAALDAAGHPDYYCDGRHLNEFGADRHVRSVAADLKRIISETSKSAN